MEQRTEEWFAARCGHATGSRVNDIIAKPRSGVGYSSSRRNYEAQIITERLTGQVAESYRNLAMELGQEREPEAVRSYEFFEDCEVEPVGYLTHPTIEMSGCSPDGLVDSDGLVEFKCPKAATHIASLLARNVPKNYMTQITWQLAVTGRAWCDYVSYSPELPDHMRLMIIRVERVDTAITELEDAVVRFLRDVDEKIRALHRFYKAEETA